MAQKHKNLTSRKNTSITPIKRCYSYASTLNKNYEVKLAVDFYAIIPHLFGGHSKCGEWCHRTCTKSSSSAITPAQLKESEGSILRKEICKVLEVHARCIKRLAPSCTTKSNESFNNFVASKYSKKT